MRVKPKPCPNCGSKYVEMWTKFFGGNGFEVRCLDCGYIGELGKQEPQPRERGITTKGERRMQDYKLKPCPFCGGRKIELVEPEYFSAVGFANALRVDKPLQQEKRWKRQ